MKMTVTMIHNDNDDDVCDEETRGSLDSSMLTKFFEKKKSGTSSNTLQACVLFVKTGI